MQISTENRFCEGRLCLALMVLLEHASDLSGSDDLRGWLFQGSELAVSIFFCISGFLVSHSLDNSPSLSNFYKKRFSRIYPAYLAMLVIFLPILIQQSTVEASSLIANQSFYSFLISHLFFLNFIEPSFPGVFLDNPVSQFNGSIWTLRIELVFYLSLPFLMIWAKRIDIKIIYILSIVLGLLWSAWYGIFSESSLRQTLDHQFPAQIPFFLGGVVIAKLDHFPISRLIILFGCCSYFYAVSNNWLLTSLSYIFLPLGSIFFLNAKPVFKNFCMSFDISYEIYLLHFPVIQLFVSLGFFNNSGVYGLIIVLISVIVLSVLIKLFLSPIICNVISNLIRKLMGRVKFGGGIL